MSARLSNSQIAWRAAQDIADGAYVNLGIGLPEMVAKFQPDGRQAIFHTENGVLNFGEAPAAGEEARNAAPNTAAVAGSGTARTLSR